MRGITPIAAILQVNDDRHLEGDGFTPEFGHELGLLG
jgi:hypothetical protein